MINLITSSLPPPSPSCGPARNHMSHSVPKQGMGKDKYRYSNQIHVQCHYGSSSGNHAWHFAQYRVWRCFDHYAKCAGMTLHWDWHGFLLALLIRLLHFHKREAETGHSISILPTMPYPSLLLALPFLFFAIGTSQNVSLYILCPLCHF